MVNINLKKRDMYLNKMIAFKDTEMIKVITGIRRCGKSSLMQLMALHLIENGIEESQIISLNFESMSLPEMTYREFYEYIKAAIKKTVPKETFANKVLILLLNGSQMD